MCYQLVEKYSACRCLYYEHPIERCPQYGRSGHPIARRVILVGYCCVEHGSQSRVSISTASSALAPRSSRQPFRQQPTRQLSRATSVVVSETKESPHSPYPPITDDDPDSSESDSELSETESVLSTTTLATTADVDALEAIFNQLLNYDELRFLWPQVVRRSGSHQRSLRNIERLLRRYSEDLEKLAARPDSGEELTTAPKQVQVNAARFVRRSRLNLSQRILEAHKLVCQTNTSHYAETSADGDGSHDIHAMGKPDVSDDIPTPFVYWVAESFLFETDPMRYLQANVKAFVKLPQPKPMTETFGDSARIWLENTAATLARPLVPEGKKRVTWTCVRISVAPKPPCQANLTLVRNAEDSSTMTSSSSEQELSRNSRRSYGRVTTKTRPARLRTTQEKTVIPTNPQIRGAWQSNCGRESVASAGFSQGPARTRLHCRCGATEDARTTSNLGSAPRPRGLKAWATTSSCSAFLSGVGRRNCTKQKYAGSIRTRSCSRSCGITTRPSEAGARGRGCGRSTVSLSSW